MQNLSLSMQKFHLKIQKLNLKMLKLNLKMLKLKKPRKYLRKFSWIDAQKKKPSFPTSYVHLITFMLFCSKYGCAMNLLASKFP